MSLDTLLAFIFVLGVVIVVHEGGHFLMAKAVGIYVRTFSIGFGPKLLRRRIGQTEYALSAIPFGGYVKMAGEGLMESIQDSGTGETTEDGDPVPVEQHFSSKSPWQRMAVVTAGPVMNLVLALVVCVGLVWVDGVLVTPVTTIGEVDADGPAAAAGLQSGDQFLGVAGTPVEAWEDILRAIVGEAKAERLPIPVSIERAGATMELALDPERDAASGYWILGMDYKQDTRVGIVKKDGPAHRAGLQRGDVIVSIDGNEVSDYSTIAGIINESIDVPLELRWLRNGESMQATVVPEAAEHAIDYQNVETIGRIYYEPYRESRQVGFVQAARMGSRATWGMVEQTASFLVVLVRGGASSDAVSGPIRIGQFAGEMVRWGFDRLLLFLALFSVNLFLLNLLPVPVLDGGHAVFILYEMVARRRPNERVQMVATQVGFVLLLLLMAFVITMDVIKVAS